MKTSLSTAELPRSAPSGELQVEFFDSPLSPELWEAYERATRSYACTRAFIEYFEDSAGASLALVRSRRAGEDEGCVRCTGWARDGSALVLGRFCGAHRRGLGAFADAIFARHPRVRRIDTNLVDALPDSARDRATRARAPGGHGDAGPAATQRGGVRARPEQELPGPHPLPRAPPRPRAPVRSRFSHARARRHPALVDRGRGSSSTTSGWPRRTPSPSSIQRYEDGISRVASVRTGA